MLEFVPLDNVLMLAGCRIHIPNRGYRIANRIFMLLVFASYAFTCYAHLFVITMSDEPLTFLMFYADAIFGTIFVIIMIRKRKAFQSILSQAFLLSDPQRMILRNHSRCCMSLLLLTFFQSYVLMSIHLWRALWWHIVVDTVRTYMVFNSWFIGGSCAYTFLVKLIAAREETFFHRLNHALTKSLTQTERVDLILERRRLTEFKESVLHAFSLIPCLWFAFIFIKIGMVYENTSFAEHPAMIALRAFEVVLLILILVYVIDVCESVTARTKKMTTAVETALIQSGRMSETSDVMHELRESSNFAFAVCSVFDINRRTALSFLSSLITFTVLFVQMSLAWKRKG